MELNHALTLSESTGKVAISSVQKESFGHGVYHVWRHYWLMLWLHVYYNVTTNTFYDIMTDTFFVITSIMTSLLTRMTSLLLRWPYWTYYNLYGWHHKVTWRQKTQYFLYLNLFKQKMFEGLVGSLLARRAIDLKIRGWSPAYGSSRSAGWS